MSKTYQAYRCTPAHKLRCKALADARGVNVTDLLTAYVETQAKRLGIVVPDDAPKETAP